MKDEEKEGEKENGGEKSKQPQQQKNTTWLIWVCSTRERIVSISFLTPSPSRQFHTVTYTDTGKLLPMILNQKP